VLAVRRKLGPRTAVEGVGAGGCLGEGVGAYDFSSSNLGEVFLLLLFVSKKHKRQRSYSGMRAPGRRKAGILGDAVGDQARRDLIHFESAVGLGNIDRGEAEVAGLLQQLAGDGVVLVLHLLGVGDDFVVAEIVSGLCDEAVLVGEILRRENVGKLAFFEQEAAARDAGLGWSSRGHGNLV